MHNHVLFICPSILESLPLIHRCPVYAVEISGRFDVGCLNSYIECDNHFSDQGIHSCADR